MKCVYYNFTSTIEVVNFAGVLPTIQLADLKYVVVYLRFKGTDLNSIFYFDRPRIFSKFVINTKQMFCFVFLPLRL